MPPHPRPHPRYVRTHAPSPSPSPTLRKNACLLTLALTLALTRHSDLGEEVLSHQNYAPSDHQHAAVKLQAVARQRSGRQRYLAHQQARQQAIKPQPSISPSPSPPFPHRSPITDHPHPPPLILHPHPSPFALTLRPHPSHPSGESEGAGNGQGACRPETRCRSSNCSAAGDQRVPTRMHARMHMPPCR